MRSDALLELVRPIYDFESDQDISHNYIEIYCGKKSYEITKWLIKMTRMLRCDAINLSWIYLLLQILFGVTWILFSDTKGCRSKLSPYKIFGRRQTCCENLDFIWSEMQWNQIHNQHDQLEMRKDFMLIFCNNISLSSSTWCFHVPSNPLW